MSDVIAVVEWPSRADTCLMSWPASKLVVSGLPTLSNGSPRRTRLWESPSPLVRFWRCRGCSILSCDTTELDATSRQPLQHSDVTTLLTCRFALTAHCGPWRARLPFSYGAVITLSGE